MLLQTAAMSFDRACARSRRQKGPMEREARETEAKIVAMRLITDEGAFICNIVESDIAKMAAKRPGTLVVMHYAIRVDAMFEGRYEIHRTKLIETSSIDFYESFQKGGALDAGEASQPMAQQKWKDG